LTPKLGKHTAEIRYIEPELKNLIGQNVMKTIDEIKSILKEHKEEIKERFKVKEVGIFGSYVKGIHKEGSDLDLIVEFVDECSIGGFEYVGLMTELEEYFQKILNMKSHLASRRHALSSDKWKEIEKEIVYIFEQHRKDENDIK